MSNYAKERVSEIVNTDDSLYRTVIRLQKLPFEIDPVLETNPELCAALFGCVDAVTTLALREEQPDARLDFHRALHNCLKLRISRHRNRHELSYYLNGLTTRMMKAWLDHETQRINVSDVCRTNPEGFKKWFVQVLARHPAIDHSLYTYLEEQADSRGFRYFVAQERTVDAGFADLIALTQVGADHGPKLGMADNYWDEMGTGNLEKAHAVMFDQVLSLLDIADVGETDLAWVSLACGNLFVILAAHRLYYYMSVGCLAATEMAVPKRFERLSRGGRRLSLPQKVIDYYLAHVLSDSEHANGWLDKIVLPAVSNQPEVAVDVAKGVLLRLNTSKAYCDCILDTLQNGVPAQRWKSATK